MSGKIRVVSEVNTTMWTAPSSPGTSYSVRKGDLDSSPLLPPAVHMTEHSLSCPFVLPTFVVGCLVLALAQTPLGGLFFCVGCRFHSKLFSAQYCSQVLRQYRY